MLFRRALRYRVPHELVLKQSTLQKYDATLLLLVCYSTFVTAPQLPARWPALERLLPWAVVLVPWRD